MALVVGVMSYSAKPLNNAVTDADSVTKLLEAHGFEIISVEPDPTRDELLSAIFMLQNRVSQLNIKGPSHGCVAVFYYAGHGLLGDSGTHYMLGSDWKTSLPTVGKLTVSQALQLYGVELSEALDSMKDAYAGIALVDACQELCDDAHGSSAAATRHLGDLNCSSPSSAAAELSEQLPKQLTRGWGGDAIGKSHLSQNLLVAHACAPQHTASDGLGQGAFTSCLLKVSQKYSCNFNKPSTKQPYNIVPHPEHRIVCTQFWQLCFTQCLQLCFTQCQGDSSNQISGCRNAHRRGSLADGNQIC